MDNMRWTKMYQSKRYKARSGAHISDEQAQKYGSHLEKLMKKLNGKVTTEQIVEDAKKKKSPIHEYFEWNDTKAAGEYRKHQARLLKNSIVVVEKIRDEEVEMPAFIHYEAETNEKEGNGEKKERYYVSLDTAMSDSKIRKQYLQKTIHHLKNVQYYLELLQEFE